MPATGVAGASNDSCVARAKRSIPEFPASPQVFVVTVNESVWNEAVKIVNNSEAKTSQLTRLKRRPLSKQLEYADALK